jgi:hypothetical protein
MKLYHYDKDTKEYIGSSEARLDPLELQINKVERYLIPANAATEEPPECKESETVIYVDSKWAVVNKPEKPEEKPHVETPEELALKEKVKQRTLLRAEIQAELESTETKTIAALKAIMLKLLDAIKEI